MTTAKTALVPFGQVKPKKPSAVWVADYKRMREEPHEWPRTLVSFELWCAMTEYDVKHEDGGEVFQKLMHYLLTEGVGPISEKDLKKYPKKHYSGGYGEQWILDKTGRYNMGQKQAHTSTTAAKHEIRGADVGQYSRGADTKTGRLSKGFDYDDHTVFSGYQQSVAKRPYCRVNWMQMIHVSLGKRPDTHDSSGGFVTDGTGGSGVGRDDDSKCFEAFNCMATGNIIAALYGLYFYPDCRKHDWTVTHDNYTVRMRMWNPQYELLDGKLFVQEPLNTEERPSLPKSGQRYVGGGPTSTTQGDKYGMHLPPMFFEQGLPMEPNQIIKTLTDEKTRLAPFYWGSGFGGPTAEKMLGSCRAVAAAFPSVAHKPEDYLMWGFNCPKAHWLYPHFPPTFTKGELTVTMGATGNKLPGNSAYQPWPVWAPLFDTPIKRAKVNPLNHQTKKHWMLLQWDIPDVNKVDERRKYALGLPYTKPMRTQHAPSVVERPPATYHRLASDVDLAEEAELRRLEAGEPTEEEEERVLSAAFLKGLNVADLKERLEAKGLGTKGSKADLIQRLLDGAPEDEMEQERPESIQTLMADQDLDNVTAGQASVSIGFAKDNALNAMTEDALAENETEQLADQKHETKEHQFNRAAGVNKGARLTALEPGAEQSTRDVNPHFKSYNDSPWPHKDIYSVSKLKFVPGKVMEPDMLEEYKKRYGSTHNLYLRGETTPKTLEDIEPVYGLAQDIINTKITEKTDLHQKHLCRILAIYFHDGDIGYQSGNMSCVISAKNKKLGMLQGVYGPKDASPLATQEELRLHYGKPKGTNWQLLWGPVFKTEPPKELAKRITMKAMRGEDTLLKGCVEGTDTGNIQSDMTVREWITTPWHYNFLPYQPEQILFRDGETFSEGCRRCSRPFHEAEHMYMWYRLSHDHTEGWPLVYWRDSNRKGEIAPQPFHSKQFWSEQEKVPDLRPNRDRTFNDPAHNGAETKEIGLLQDVPEGYDEDGGWHNWPTFDFLLDKKGVLADEYHRRFNTAERKKMTATREALYRRLAKRPANFKRYENLAYSSDRAKWWTESAAKAAKEEAKEEEEGEYPDYPQSRCSRGRVKLGMREYKLQRASKYGNTCRDCAATLEYAPGLFKRNHRAVTALGVVKGREEKQQTTLWWGNLIGRTKKVDKKGRHSSEPWVVEGRMDKDDAEAVRNAFRFDPDFLHTQKKKSLSRMKESERAEYNLQFTKGMEILTGFMQKQHSTFAMGNRTKHTKEPPEIYIQKKVPGYEDSTKKEDYELINEAVRDLRRMLNGEFDINTGNQALRDMVYELERKYVHESRFNRDLSTRVFDSDMMRLEKRNVTRTKPGGGGTFYNCLETRIYQPQNGVMDTPDPEKDYKVCIYYANRKGLNGEECETGGSMQDGKKVSDESMWCGDGFVAAPPLDESGQQKPDEPYVTVPDLHPKYLNQWRPMRQSRLFITYALHRPVTSELEARGVLEKMADAAHELFGNDYYLSQLLVFGYKLTAFDKKESRSDTLSKGTFEVISKTNKKDAMPSFYGEGGNTSYLYDTYETHVDSVSVDGGMEIGPTRKHPHFHVLLTVNHWSYIQIDYFKMNAFLEMMFLGVDVAEFGWGERFKLPAHFYTDAENPYVDIRVYPQDNWQDIIAAYVRKNSTPGIFEALGDRGGVRPKPYSDAPAE